MCDVLIVDDEQAVCWALQQALAREGHRVAVAVDPEGYIPFVQFFAGERLIGVSRIDFIVAPEPGTPIHHQFTWLTKPFHHGSASRAKGVSTRATPIPLTLAIMNPNGTLPS